MGTSGPEATVVVARAGGVDGGDQRTRRALLAFQFAGRDAAARYLAYAAQRRGLLGSTKCPPP